MATELVKPNITEASGNLAYTSLVTDITEEAEQDFILTLVKAESSMRDYLTSEDDPVLASLWDNEDDAAYDDL